MEIQIDAALRQCWPETRLGVLTFSVEVLKEAPGLAERMASCLPSLRVRMEETPFAAWPNLAESRAAFRACGKDPGRYRVSSEALLRRVRQGKDLYQINSVVDVNNLVSLHKKCFDAVNNPGVDISGFDAKAQKKIIGYREKLKHSHTRNK